MTFWSTRIVLRFGKGLRLSPREDGEILVIGAGFRRVWDTDREQTGTTCEFHTTHPESAARLTLGEHRPLYHAQR
jgi:hypothetical protein